MSSTSLNKTLGDLVKFVLRNRKGYDFFTGYSVQAIARELTESAKVNGLRYVLDDRGAVSALITAFPRPDGLLHVNQIRCLRLQDMRTLVAEYFKVYSDRPLTALRKGKRIYYTKSAIRKLQYGRK